MPHVKLTDSLVRRTLDQAASRDVSFFDVDLPRFFLRVRPSARRGSAASYFVRYSDTQGRDRRIRIGSPDTMSVTDARQAARKTLAAIDLGGDPAARKREARDRLSVRELVTAYRSSPAWRRKTDQTRRSDEIRFDKHILHRLATMSIPELSPPVVRRFIEDVRTDFRIGARNRRLGGDGCARKCCRLLSAVVAWAVEFGHAEQHPFRGAIRLEGDGSRDAVITDPADFLKIVSAMDDMVRERELSEVGQGFVTLLMVTGMRRGEARTLTWGQIDFHQKLVVLPDTKGAKLAKRNGAPEIVHLPPLAMTMLERVRPAMLQNSGLVFPPTRGRNIETTRLWARIRTRAGVRPDLTLHGLRHSVGTVAALRGLGILDVKAILRHRQASTSERYVKAAEIAKTRHLDAIADFMTSPTLSRDDS